MIGGNRGKSHFEMALNSRSYENKVADIIRSDVSKGGKLAFRRGAGFVDNPVGKSIDGIGVLTVRHVLPPGVCRTWYGDANTSWVGASYIVDNVDEDSTSVGWFSH